MLSWDHLLHLVDVVADPFLQLGTVKVLAAVLDHAATHEFGHPAGFETRHLLVTEQRKLQPFRVFPLDPAGIHTPVLAAVAGQRQHQRLRPAGEDAVRIAPDVEAQRKDGLLRPGEGARLGTDRFGSDAGDPGGVFRAELRRLLADVREDGGDLDALDGEGAFQCRVHAIQGDGLFLGSHGALDRHRRTRVHIPVEEDLLRAAFADIRFTQQLAVVGTHENRKIRLFLDEIGLVEPLFDDRVHEGHGKERVRALLDRHPQVGVDRRGVVIGGNRNDPRTVVPGLPDVVGIWDSGDVRVEHRQHDVIGTEPGIRGEAFQRVAIGEMRSGIEVAHVGEDIQLNPAHERGETVGCREAHHRLVARPGMGHQVAGAVSLEDVDDLVGDFLGRLVPADALPLALAPGRRRA